MTKINKQLVPDTSNLAPRALSTIARWGHQSLAASLAKWFGFFLAQLGQNFSGVMPEPSPVYSEGFITGANKETISPRAVSNSSSAYRLGHSTGLLETGQLLDSFYHYSVEQNGSDCRQAIHYVFDNGFRTTSIT